MLLPYRRRKMKPSNTQSQLTKSKEFFDMNYDVLTYIIRYLSVAEKLQLRAVSTRMRDIVDDYRSWHHTVVNICSVSMVRCMFACHLILFQPGKWYTLDG